MSATRIFLSVDELRYAFGKPFSSDVIKLLDIGRSLLLIFLPMSNDIKNYLENRKKLRKNKKTLIVKWELVISD